MKHSFQTLLFTLTLLHIGYQTASATTLNLTNVDSQRFQSVNLRIDNQNTTSSAGVIQASYDGGPSIDLFCVDLFTSIGYGVWDSFTIAPRPERYEDRVAWLYVNLYNPATINTTQLGAAFQVAIWDIVHDGGDGVNQGRIQSNSSTSATIVNAWQHYLSASSGQISQNASIYINSRANTPAQTLIGLRQGSVTTFTSTVEEVPEPGPALLVAAGLAILFIRKGQFSIRCG